MSVYLIKLQITLATLMALTSSDVLSSSNNESSACEIPGFIHASVLVRSFDPYLCLTS